MAARWVTRRVTEAEASRYSGAAQRSAARTTTSAAANSRLLDLLNAPSTLYAHAVQRNAAM